MKKFTLFNNKWHPIRFIFWIFATKNDYQEMKIDPRYCKMQALMPVLLKKWKMTFWARCRRAAPAVEQFKK